MSKIYLNPNAIKENTIPINKIVTVDLDGKQDIIDDLDDIRNGAAKGATALQSVPEIYVTKDDLKKVNNVSYSELKTLRDSSQLVSGQQYRITDYVTTTTQANTRSAGHQFDVIVTADNENTLNYIAKACLHEGDTYFSEAGANLAAWQIWYSLDNDSKRFAWADTKNGTGVIYRMIDEWGNDCPYDFKNIMFKHPTDSKTYPSTYYTFSYDTLGSKDMSLKGEICYNNKIENYGQNFNDNINPLGSLKLPRNVFISRSSSWIFIGNIIGSHCNNNSFEYQCCFNKLESSDNNEFKNHCSYNEVKNCHNMRLDSNTCNNTFENCSHIKSEEAIEYSVFKNCSHITSKRLEFCSFFNIHSLRNIDNQLKSCVFKNNAGSLLEFDYSILDGIEWHNPMGGIVVEQYQTYEGTNISVSLSHSDIMKISYNRLKLLRNNNYLKPGYKYRIIDYSTTTSQENTKSAEHKFDIIVTATSYNTLSEEAQAIQNDNEGYFDDSNLSAWKIWYSLDNDTERFEWADIERIDHNDVETILADSSECTIKSDLIDGNTFITPFNFESCVWVDDGDGVIPYDGGSNHDEEELIYEWGYFTDEDDNTHLCLYKSNAGLYEEEGQPDYGDKYLYRGVVNVDGTDYDYWQKWDENGGGLDVQGSGDYVFATTPRIVANPEAYSCETTTETIETVIPLEPKGVIYRMIDEFGNDCPYDFKNIMFKCPINESKDEYPDYYYTFTNVDKYNEVHDVSLNHGIFNLNVVNNVFNCFDSGYELSNLRLNLFIAKISKPEYKIGFANNSFGSNCHDNMFGEYFHNNSFGNDCHSNSFGIGCYSNSFGDYCHNNNFGNDCSCNSFGNRCYSNSFGNSCWSNSFSNNCQYNSFRLNSSTTGTLLNYCYHNHFDDGCSYNIIWNNVQPTSSNKLQNINIVRGVYGAYSTYNFINIVDKNADYEIKVAKNSKGEIKIYCEADLIE